MSDGSPNENQRENKIMLNHFELDRRIGGFPYPTLTLIEGINDSGKSVLAQQITYGALENCYRVRYITTENTIKSLLRDMKSLTYDVTTHFIKGKLKITELHVEKLSWNKIVSRQYLRMINKLIENDDKTDVFIIDSITYVATHSSNKDILEFFTTMRNTVDEYNKAVFITIHPHSFEEDLLIRIRSVCGGHITLEINDMGGRTIRILNIKKLRGASRATNLIISFEVDPAFGIKVVPFSQAKA